MTTSTTAAPSARAEATTPAAGSHQVRVWDILVRTFHWTLVGAIAIAFLTEDELLGLHVWVGYLALGLVAIRVLWGVIGTRHARFTDFVRGPHQVMAYLKDVLVRRAPRYLGHNPAGGAMILALLVAIVATGLTGISLDSAGAFGGEALEEVHEFFAYLTLTLVITHVGGVLLSSLLHRENLIKSMITGYKRRAG
ncbi:cytochrome B [Thiorhodococcus mannitoliphagus]|uniref:Cytochrome B n=1 Tax=Thiorhodococcus mannitoliphagus TaxID=329406 RepID=A0A6P1DZV3_9GAMM|nr:cytochrome b/b6 domain-containing protein [Thiorhodococcus mannitoliphagus]NEX22561.1 cytochrome B [Thiorhodococcus mannitoliphagus]